MKNKKIIRVFAIILIILLLTLIVLYYISKSNHSNSKEESIRTEGTNLNIEYSEKELTGEWSSYKAKITLSDEKTQIEGSGVTNSGNEIKITTAGSYYITGTISDGNIIIEATKNDDVQLVLDNCNITSKTTAPINGVKCNTLTITLLEDSKNIVSDTGTYTKFTDTEKTEPDGTIFSKADLVINGTGTLTVNSNNLDGIVSKDILKIINSSIDVTSKDDGIRGKDYVAINSANITINANSDGIKSTNTEDENLGYIVIEGGNLNITAKNDGIQAETILNISQNAEINIKTTTSQSSKSSNNNNFRKRRFWRKRRNVTTKYHKLRGFC